MHVKQITTATCTHICILPWEKFILLFEVCFKIVERDWTSVRVRGPIFLGISARLTERAWGKKIILRFLPSLFTTHCLLPKKTPLSATTLLIRSAAIGMEWRRRCAFLLPWSPSSTSSTRRLAASPSPTPSAEIGDE
jgi:hypothetical protein